MNQIRKFFLYGTVTGMLLILCFGLNSSSVARAQGPVTPTPSNPYFTRVTRTLSDGRKLDANIINGPPTPPPGFARAAVALPKSNKAMGTAALTVPAYNWVFGCSSVSGAMIAAYYDRNGFSNMYTGPTNGGVMPLDNSTTYWPTWSDGYTTYPNLPLAASHNGVDGRSSRGSIDDYWVRYGSSTQDPYITNGWTQHTWGDAIGDYMKTSQSSYYNTDGSTTFYNYSSSASPLSCSAMVSYGIQTLDGTYGRKLFYEARGYPVTTCYNQYTDNMISGGFSFAQYKAEIDAGRPVMLNLDGHTIVGVGYDDSSNRVYLNDTWDYFSGTTHYMTWGGSYSGMALQSVSIVNLQNPVPTITVLIPNVIAPGGSAFTLTVNGTNFASDSIVRWNWSDRTTTYVSGTQLTANILAADIATAGSASITVYNPTSGFTSNAVTFWIAVPQYFNLPVIRK